jgi:hypothetical protein
MADESNFDHPSIRKPDNGIDTPPWGNQYLSPLELNLASSSEIVDGVDVGDMVRKGKHVDGMHTVWYVGSGRVDATTAKKIRAEKKYHRVNSVFGESGMDIYYGKGLSTFLKLPEIDETGNTTPTWEVVLLNSKGEIAGSKDDYSFLKLSETLTKAFDFLEEDGKFMLKYKSKE